MGRTIRDPESLPAGNRLTRDRFVVVGPIARPPRRHRLFGTVRHRTRPRLAIGLNPADGMGLPALRRHCRSCPCLARRNEKPISPEFVANLLKASAPERLDEITALRKQYDPQFFVADDGPGCLLMRPLPLGSGPRPVHKNEPRPTPGLFRVSYLVFTLASAAAAVAGGSAKVTSALPFTG